MPLLTCRVRPIAPIIFLEPTADEVIAGVTVPAGTPIFVLSGYAAKLDDHFTAAETFDPERWLTPKSAGHDTRAFLPFGAGPRFCPGRNLAMLEATMVLAMMVANFDVAAASAGPVRERFAFTLQPVNLAVRLSARRTRPH